MLANRNKRVLRLTVLRDVATARGAYALDLEGNLRFDTGSALDYIESEQFSHNQRVVDVLIPRGVHEVRDRAFENCYQLR